MENLKQLATNFALKKFDSILEFDKEIESFLDLEYEQTKVFMKTLMRNGSSENKNYSYISEPVMHYIKKYSDRIKKEILSDCL